MLALIPDERDLVLVDETYFELRKNAAGHRQGPAFLSAFDKAPLD